MFKPSTDTNSDQKATTGHYIRVVAVVVFGLSLLGYLMLQVYPQLEIRSILVYTKNPLNEDGSLEEGDHVYALARQQPVRMRIPKLGVETEFVAPLGLAEDGTITVPDEYEKVGWYKLGAAPGEVGTASILGHVDSYLGPAVFFSLGQLAPGDRIQVEREDGSTAEFEVEYLERYPQSEFPTEKVYAPTPFPSLRLITCSGLYEKGEERYTHNLVVYARLINPREDGDLIE